MPDDGYRELTAKERWADVLIIGGGTAGCFAALTLGREKGLRVLVAEKANIKRSGCLAAGVNAINAYITKGRRPEDYADYAAGDAEGIVRDDLLLSMSRRLNHVTAVMEELGLVILKDENGEYVTRGNRNIKINGENIKPILADAARRQENVTVLNHVNITDYIVQGGRVCGAYGFDVNERKAYVIHAPYVLCATGGAAGLYRPNNPGFSRHKMWYPPFNTGAGYAMGILAGAEMTTLEMRFIALRCKDTIAPTGTIAQGVGAKQTNSRGEIYETRYGLKTSQRLYGTVMENREGRGPCYLDTTKISPQQEEELFKAYLNMAPSQTLRWLESGTGPSGQPVEVEGTEPYVVGGHTASGYWIDNERRTTLRGLYAAGDVAGGAPQKYVTGALAEGEIAAEAILKDRARALREQEGYEGETPRGQSGGEQEAYADGTPRGQGGEEQGAYVSGSLCGRRVGEQEAYEDESLRAQITAKADEYQRFLNREPGLITAEQLEMTMQKIMDQYAGGISADYRFNESGLDMAERQIERLYGMLDMLAASDMYELMKIYELRDRLIVCRALIAHLRARKETRWHSFAENTDYPEKDDAWRLYVNSRLEGDAVRTFTRQLVTRGAEPLDFSKGGVS